MEDNRFNSFRSDPRSRKVPKNVSQVKIDDRFHKMFKNRHFDQNTGIDKRGRRLDLTAPKHLKSLYNVKESSEEDSDSSVEKTEACEEDSDSSGENSNTSEEDSDSSGENNTDSDKNSDSSGENSMDSAEDIDSTGENTKHVISNANKNIVKIKKEKRKDVDEYSSNVKQSNKIKKEKNAVDDINNHMKPGSSKMYFPHNEERHTSKIKKENEIKKEKLHSTKQDEFLENRGIGKSKNNNRISQNDEKCDISKIKKENKIKEEELHSNEQDEFFENRGIYKSKNKNRISKNKNIHHDERLNMSNEEEKSDAEQLPINQKHTERNIKDSRKKDTDSENENSVASDYEMSGNGSDKDSEDDEDSDDESKDSDASDGMSSRKGNEFDHDWEELDKDALDTDAATRRLALCNMDWDRIRVDDLYVAFNSFKPEGGIINSVTIYPSEFGLKRMEQEKLHGPAELVEETVDLDEKESKSTKGSRYHREKLRQYQLRRLKYYYAVIDCDSAETANTLYEQLNGMEYESSSIRFDLRFIPDDMTFDQEPASVADKAPESTAYKPRLFANSALQQVKVNLTWDETDPRRREILQKAFTEPESIEEDIKEYLASTSGDSDDEDEDRDEEGMTLTTKERISRYKALLQDIDEEKRKEEEAKGFDLEITWVPGLKEKTEKIAKGKMEAPLTPFEEIVRKKKDERRSKKKNKKPDFNSLEVDSDESDVDQQSDTSPGKKASKRTDELYLMTDSKKKDNEESNFNKKGKKKNKRNNQEKASTFQCNITDPRFSAIYTSHDFNIDPSHPSFKQTEGSLAIVKEKQKRLQDDYTFSKKKKNKKTKFM